MRLQGLLSICYEVLNLMQNRKTCIIPKVMEKFKCLHSFVTLLHYLLGWINEIIYKCSYLTVQVSALLKNVRCSKPADLSTNAFPSCLCSTNGHIRLSSLLHSGNSLKVVFHLTWETSNIFNFWYIKISETNFYVW